MYVLVVKTGIEVLRQKSKVKAAKKWLNGQKSGPTDKKVDLNGQKNTQTEQKLSVGSTIFVR